MGLFDNILDKGKEAFGTVVRSAEDAIKSVSISAPVFTKSGEPQKVNEASPQKLPVTTGEAVNPVSQPVSMFSGSGGLLIAGLIGVGLIWAMRR